MLRLMAEAKLGGLDATRAKAHLGQMQGLSKFPLQK